MVINGPAGSADKSFPETRLTFRWAYVIIPAVVFVLAVVLAGSFYGMLPAEMAYHFEDGLPDRWLGKAALMAWFLVPQLVFLLCSFGIISVTGFMSRRLKLAESPQIKKLLAVMGNMVALPQVILLFAMLDIFLYNAYQIRLLPVWAFALIVMLLGGVVMAVVFIQALRQSSEQPGKRVQE